MTQRRALVAAFALGAAVALAVVGTIVLLDAKDPGAPRQTVYTVRSGDIARDPRTGIWCIATGEGGLPNLYCKHTTQGRHAVVFWDDELQIYGTGSGPLEPTYSFDWWPKLR
jgi:hypothetical protein